MTAAACTTTCLRSTGAGGWLLAGLLAEHVGVVLDPAKHRVIDCADSPDDDRPGVGDAITQRVAEFFWDAKPAFRKPAIFVWALNVAGGPG